METFTYAEINATGRANLVKWLKRVLKETAVSEEGYAEAFADGLIAEHDGSDPEESQVVEVSSHQTEKGYVQTYTFRPDELTLVTYDADGKTLSRQPLNEAKA